MDIESATLDAPSDPQIVFNGGLSRGARTHRPGSYSVSGNVVYAADIRTLGWFIKWALGGYKFTAEAAGPPIVPAFHEMYASQDQILPSFCGRVGKDLFEHGFSGLGINSLQIQSSNEFVTITVDTVGSSDFQAALKEISALSLPVEYPLAFHEARVLRAASNISADVKEWTLTINNNADADAGYGQDSRHPYRILSGEREVTLSMNLYYRNLDHLHAFWGGSSGPTAVGATEFGMNFILDAGDDGELDIAGPRWIYTAVPQQPSGKDEITQNVSVKAFEGTHTLADGVTTVLSEVLATLQNSEPQMIPAP